MDRISYGWFCRVRCCTQIKFRVPHTTSRDGSTVWSISFRWSVPIFTCQCCQATSCTCPWDAGLRSICAASPYGRGNPGSIKPLKPHRRNRIDEGRPHIPLLRCDLNPESPPSSGLSSLSELSLGLFSSESFMGSSVWPLPFSHWLRKLASYGKLDCTLHCLIWCQMHIHDEDTSTYR